MITSNLDNFPSWSVYITSSVSIVKEQPYITLTTVSWMAVMKLKHLANYCMV